METRNAIIRYASIELEEGALKISLSLDYGNLCQVFGGLYHPRSPNVGKLIYSILNIAEADTWPTLINTAIRAKCDPAHVYAIGHIIKDEWIDEQGQSLRECWGIITRREE